MSLMWMPAHTTDAAAPTARSAAGTSSPTGAKMIAASSSSGAGPSRVAGPLAAELAREGLRRPRRPARVKAKTRRPWCRATWQTMWALAPKP